MFDSPSAGLHQALATWREWDLGLTVQPTVVGLVPGGRTNRNYHLATHGQGPDLVLRLNTRYASRVGIQREHEKIILDAVADAGLCLAPLYWDPEYRFTLSPYVEARTWSARDFSDPARLHQARELVAVAHELRPATPVRRYSDYLVHYWQQLDAADAVDDRLRAEWEVFYSQLKAFDAAAWTPKLTHHDLIPENIMESADRLYLIDWEYAALGHPDIDAWCLDPTKVREPFIHGLALWTNDLWERLVLLLNQ